MIFTDGKTAKVFDGAPTGRVDGVDLYGENAAEELRKKYEPAAFDFEDVSDHNEVDFEEIEEELEESAKDKEIINKWECTQKSMCVLI